MNITLDNVILSNSEGTIFEKRPEIYVHGTQIKGMRMSNEVIEKIQEPRNNENRRDNRARNNQGNNKGYNNNNNNRRRNYNNQDERRQRGGRDQRQQH
ncbi:unnamed protein product [Kuraishia capsulata CBS 1993]|uniref:LSM domain-containing protein n=1 Tax=Kuraishia capsulata CBS 1993 TaxID=1382522 RepID=W6MWT1_9ASCO|nr:uncharacterized protein KUCA_T00003804001 [Kuraishia capsulata CBS 1993]CDK27825.1 unnamed protein product [Kuraishia capsulata CBS 1993]